MPCYAHPELKAKIEQAAEGKTLFRCCMFFVSQLYLKSTEEDVANPGAYVPLHSTISQQIYTTRFYGLTTRTLRRIGAIQVLKGGSYLPRLDSIVLRGDCLTQPSRVICTWPWLGPDIRLSMTPKIISKTCLQIDALENISILSDLDD